MPDTRQKDLIWRVTTDDGKLLSIMEGGAAHLAVLMDIRDQLMKLNNLLHCQNFTGIPITLQQIRRNTAKPRKKKKVVTG